MRDDFHQHIKTYFTMFHTLLEEASIDDYAFLIGQFEGNIDFIPISYKPIIEAEIDYLKITIVKKLPSFNVDKTYYTFKQLEDEAKISVRNEKIEHVLRG